MDSMASRAWVEVFFIAGNPIKRGRTITGSPLKRGSGRGRRHKQRSNNAIAVGKGCLKEGKRRKWGIKWSIQAGKVAGKIPGNYRGVDREYDRELKINGREIPLRWPERRGNVFLASIRGEYEGGEGVRR